MPRRPLMADTPLEVEEVWLKMQHERGPVWRIQRMAEMTSFCWRAGQEAVRRAHPDATQEEQDLVFISLRYGEELAQGVVQRRRGMGFYDDPD